ncbi:hypothetical protein BH23ACT9_BH23ACT9_31290 [soil metagenome]
MSGTHEQRFGAIVQHIRAHDAAPGDIVEPLMELRDRAEAELAADATAFLRDADAELVALFGNVGPHRLTNQHLADPPPPPLTSRYGDAVTWAAELHRDQRRTGTEIPYIAHLLGASSFLLEQPVVDEDQAIAALLHDAVEDQPHQADIDAIAERFGPRVAGIVADCTDAWEQPKPPWRHRKTAYMAHLEGVGFSTLQVSLADKLHNARAIVTDLETTGASVWTRFNAPPVAQHWYYTHLAELFGRRLGTTVAQALQRSVERMTANLPHDIELPEGHDRPAWVGVDSVTGATADLEGAARVADTTVADLISHGGSAWATPDGLWWIEDVWSGDTNRPLTVFIRPADLFDPAA